MNIINLTKSNLLIVLCFFPTFIFRSNLNIIEIIYSLLIFIGPLLLINRFIFKKKIFINKFFILYIALIITYGIDNHLGLWNGFIQPFRHGLIDIFGIIYIPALIYFLGCVLLISYIIFIKNKLYNVILVFLFTIFIFNIFDPTKSYDKAVNFKKETNNHYANTTVVLVLDEMAGLTSYESLGDGGQKFNEQAKAFFKKYNFEFYSNINSINRHTLHSVTAYVNLTDDLNTRIKTTKLSNNYFVEYELTKSNLFKKFKNISVYQNIHLNYCNFHNITKCEGYNPFEDKKYLLGFKDSFLTKIISIWKVNGSIISAFTWRFLRQIRIIDSILEPEVHKASFSDLFYKLKNDIKSKNYDLIYIHSLVPHTPYGFDDKCNYDGSKSVLNRYVSIKNKVKQHNLERGCVLFFLSDFLDKLKDDNLINNIDLTILSDHGARIKRGDTTSELPVIYARRNSKTNFKEIKDKMISQNIFADQFK